MMNDNYILEEATAYIYLWDGAIVHESIFDNHFDGDLDVLLSCVENNIVDGIIDEGDAEMIDWSMVFSDYEAAMEAKEEADGKETKS